MGCRMTMLVVLVLSGCNADRTETPPDELARIWSGTRGIGRCEATLPADVTGPPFDTLRCLCLGSSESAERSLLLARQRFLVAALEDCGFDTASGARTDSSEEIPKQLTNCLQKATDAVLYDREPVM